MHIKKKEAPVEWIKRNNHPKEVSCVIDTTDSKDNTALALNRIAKIKPEIIWITRISPKRDP